MELPTTLDVPLKIVFYFLGIVAAVWKIILPTIRWFINSVVDDKRGGEFATITAHEQAFAAQGKDIEELKVSNTRHEKSINQLYLTTQAIPNILDTLKRIEDNSSSFGKDVSDLKVMVGRIDERTKEK